MRTRLSVANAFKNTKTAVLSVQPGHSSVDFLNAFAKPLDIVVCCLATAADEKILERAFLMGIIHHIGQLSLPWKLRRG